MRSATGLRDSPRSGDSPWTGLRLGTVPKGAVPKNVMRSATGLRDSPLSGARLRSVGMHGPDQRDRAGAHPQVVQVLGLGEGSGALETRVVAGSAVYTPISGARANGVAGVEVDARQDAAGLEV